MLQSLARLYYRLTLGHPWLVSLAVLLLLAGAAHQAQHFRLDASSDSLVAENNEEIRYYREISARYGSDEFLIVTYKPEVELFSQAALAELENLRDDLAGLDFARDVTSILDVPLLDSPAQTLSDVQQGIRTLGDDDVDPQLAREEFLTSPLYEDLLVNDDADVTAVLVTLERDQRLAQLIERRDELRILRSDEGLTGEQQQELRELDTAIAERNAELQDELDAEIGKVRSILDEYRDDAEIHLGGVPMITVDMIKFVRDDIRTFGVAVGLFIIVLLALAFGRLRWVVVPSVICAAVALGMVGFLGFMSWPVTVVSSNFISLVLIITLSLIVHLIVRHRELHTREPSASQGELLRRTVDSKFKPSFYTAVTTFVSFATLMFADIQPVMDFGRMMASAVVFAFVLAFIAFPALLAPTSPGPVPRQGVDLMGGFTRGVCMLASRHGGAIWVLFALVVVIAVAGMTRLTVENRFIDFFHESTEIHQGMLQIDRELGGTTPLDIVLDAPASYLESEGEAWEDDFALDAGQGPTSGYWFNEFQMDEVTAIHDWLDEIETTGKVLSVATTHKMITHLNGGEPPDTLQMAVIYQRLPEQMRRILYDPYMSNDGNQLRFAVRVVDSDPDLRRDALLERIRTEVPERFDLEPGQVNLTGMLVLYNNVMQSLFRSQFVTLAIVFVAIMIMFGLLFRSLKMAVIGPVPTLIAACTVLGVMGLFGIPLDIMTMTIAAITVGIGVHDTIHYSDRFQAEMRRHGDYDQALEEAHTNVGRAMVYTTVIVTLGFSILTLSNFVPTIYFGLLTGVAMIFALISNMTLLPLLIKWLRPFDKDAAAGRAG